MTTDRKISRHDFSATEREMMSAAITIGLLDAISLGCLMHNHGGDAKAVLDEIDGYAEVRMHEPGKARATWIGIRDAVRYFESGAHLEEGPDPFGFRAKARDGAREFLSQHGIAVPRAK